MRAILPDVDRTMLPALTHIWTERVTRMRSILLDETPRHSNIVLLEERGFGSSDAYRDRHRLLADRLAGQALPIVQEDPFVILRDVRVVDEQAGIAVREN